MFPLHVWMMHLSFCIVTGDGNKDLIYRVFDSNRMKCLMKCAAVASLVLQVVMMRWNVAIVCMDDESSLTQSHTGDGYKVKCFYHINGWWIFPHPTGDGNEIKSHHCVCGWCIWSSLLVHEMAVRWNVSTAYGWCSLSSRDGGMMKCFHCLCRWCILSDRWWW